MGEGLNINIFSNSPTDWRDLQNKVGSVLRGIGYEVFIEKDIQTVRGTVNVDVFAMDEESVPSSVLICECKHWNYKVPKSVVHSFRTVITDFGANFGYIISKSGYQEGAFQAAENSNIKLLNWDEFLSLFEKKWLEAMMVNLHNEGLPLREYTDLLSEQYIKQVSQEKKERFNARCKELSNIALYTSKLLYEPPNGINFKDHVDSVILSFIKNHHLEDIRSYNDFIEYMISFSRKTIEDLESEFNLVL